MLAALLLAGVTAFVGIAQTGSGDSTRVRGTVTSGGPQSRPVVAAWVVATSDSDVRQTRADAKGRYLFLTLLPGVYRIFAYPPSASPNGRHAGGAIFYAGKNKLVSARVQSCSDAESPVELAAGVEYMVNVDLVTFCP
ncbi:MAG: carboxypeptidase-like regulatory domain-containing protein [Candidatus Tumulicola sp.]